MIPRLVLATDGLRWQNLGSPSSKGWDIVLGRRSCTPDEIDHAKTAIAEQLAAYKRLVKASSSTTGVQSKSVLAAFETLFFNNMTLVLDRYFVHRLRMVTGKDANPLNERDESRWCRSNVLGISSCLRLAESVGSAKYLSNPTPNGAGERRSSNGNCTDFPRG